MKSLIYADNAATTKLDRDAFEAMKPYLFEEYGNASQPYSFARVPKKALNTARETIAQCIGAEPEEIVFTSGGTESDNWAIKGAATPIWGADFPRNVVITSEFEHKATLHSCAALKRLGVPVVYLKPNASGVVLPESLRRVVSDSTRLVSIMSINNEIGTIQPIKELCAIARESGALFHTDAVQAVGRVKIDVRDLGVDFLSASAHKFNGPGGIGFLYLRKGATLAPLLDGGSQERGLRAGTENVAAIVGMAVALKKNCDLMEETTRRVREIERSFLATLTKLFAGSERSFVYNGGEPRAPGCLSLSFPGTSGEATLHRLDLMGVCVSTGSACDGLQTQISHTLQAIGVSEKQAKGTIRISFGRLNRLEDAEEIANKLAKIIGSSRK